jgi:hypothetical protein
LEAINEVKAVVTCWRAYFASIGVLAGVVTSLAAQIERPFLVNQRQK